MVRWRGGVLGESLLDLRAGECLGARENRALVSLIGKVQDGLAAGTIEAEQER